MDSRFQGRYGVIEVGSVGDDWSEVAILFAGPGGTVRTDFSRDDARTVAHLLLRAVGDEIAPVLSDGEIEIIAKEDVRAGQPVTADGRVPREPVEDHMYVEALRNQVLARMQTSPFTITFDSPTPPVTETWSNTTSKQAKACEETGRAGAPATADAFNHAADALGYVTAQPFGAEPIGRAGLPPDVREAVTPEILDAARRLVEDPGQSPASSMYVGGQFIGAPIPSEMMELSDVLSDDAFEDECAMRCASAAPYIGPHAAYDRAAEMIAERKRRREGKCNRTD